MSLVYVVRPDQRGVSAYDSRGIEHAWTTPPRLDIFSVEQPFLPPVVQRCTVRPNSVCEHGWYCTDNHDAAVMVDELRQERAAIVAWLRKQVCSATLYRVDEVSMDAASAGVVMLLAHVANSIERGEHRREEER